MNICFVSVYFGNTIVLSQLLHCILRLMGMEVFFIVAVIFLASSFAFVEKLL